MKNHLVMAASAAAIALALPLGSGTAAALEEPGVYQQFDDLYTLVREKGEDAVIMDPDYAAKWRELRVYLEYNADSAKQIEAFEDLPKPDPDALQTLPGAVGGSIYGDVEYLIGSPPGDEAELYDIEDVELGFGFPEDDPFPGSPADPEAGGPEWDETDALRIAFGYGNVETNIPQAGYGTRIVEEDEEYALETADRLDGTGVWIRISTGEVFRPGKPYDELGYWGRKFHGIGAETYADFGYTKADGNSDVSIPVGGDPVAITYHNFSEFDTTGLFLGSLGLDVRSETELDEVNLLIGRRVYRGIGENSFWGCLHALAYGYSDTDHWSYVSTPTYPDIYSESRQGINEHLFTGEAGLFAGTRTGRLSLFIEGSFFAGYRNAELDSWQETFCGACGTGQQNVTINLDDNDSGLTWGSNVEAAASFSLTPTLSLGMKYGARYLADTAAIINPENGDTLFVDNEPTYLGTDERTDQVLLFTVGKTW